MQSVLLTGAFGFVGSYTITHLLAKGFRVIACGRSIPLHSISEQIIPVQLDFTDKRRVDEVFEHYSPSIVVHAGAMSKPDECELNRENAYRINVTGTINLLEAAAKTRADFHFLSTDFVFDGEKGMYTEDDEPNPVNYYGLTKLLGEEEVKKHPCLWTIIRTVLVYGKPHGSRENIVSNTAKMLRQGLPLRIFNDQVRTPTYVEDLAAGILSLIIRRSSGIYHLSGQDVLSPYQIALAVAKHLEADESLVEAVSYGEHEQIAKRPLKTGFRINKAISEIGFSPGSFNEGLMKALS